MVTFTLGANGAEPTDVGRCGKFLTLLKECCSGECRRRGALKSRYADGKYETTFDYQFPMSGPKSAFESFRRVEVATCLPVLLQRM